MSETKAEMVKEPTGLPSLEVTLAGHLRSGSSSLIIELDYNHFGGHQPLMYLRKSGGSRSRGINILPKPIDVIVGVEDEDWPSMLRTLADALEKAIDEVSANG